jgi:tetratricopeptide (TPR) repeat protein
MTRDRFRQINDVFNSILNHKPEERPGQLNAIKQQDPDLACQVEKLLQQSTATWNFAQNQFQTDEQSMVPPPRSDARPVMFRGGEVLGGRFRIERLLGAGGMGEVYEAADLALREAVALKIVRFDAASDARMKARFAQEVYAARKIAHPNICRIHDLHHHEGSDGEPGITFLTMELVSGETLHARIRRSGPVSLADAGLIAGQLTAALMAAHSAGVIHRDFKSANVILAASPDGAMRAVVTDFGLARSLHAPAHGEGSDSLTETGKVVGTPAYMAPEQLLGGSITPAVDIYALGVVLYEMVTGQHPFHGERFAAVKRISSAPPSPRILRPDLPVRWERAILACLEREPGNRILPAPDCWTDIAVDAADLIPTASVDNTPRLKSRTRAAVAGLLGTALVFLAIAGVWFAGRHRPPAEAVRWYDEGTRALRDGTSFTAMKAFERAVQLDGDFTLAHARLAEAATELDYMDKAKSEMLRASPPAYQSCFLSSEEKLRLEAVYSTLVKDFARAAETYRKLADKVGQEERPAVLVDLGRAYESAGKFPEALNSYSESARRDRQFAAAFLRRGILESKQQQSAQAAADFDVAEQLYRTEGKAEGLTEVLYQRYAVLRRTGRLAEARAPTEKTLEMARATGDDYHQIRALLALSYLSYNSGDAQGGQQQAQQAIDLARSAGIEVLSASGLVDVGNALFSKGDDVAAEPYYRNALQAAKRFQAVRVEARAELQLGQVLANQGRTEEAVSVLKQAIDDFQQAGEKGNAGRAVIRLSEIRRDQGDYEDAAKLLRQQLQLAEQARDEGATALAAQGLGSVLLLQEQYPAALEYFDRSAGLGRAVADLSMQGYSQMSRGEALWHLGRYPDAVESLKNAEVLAQRLGGNKPLLASTYASRADMEISQQRFQDAEADLQRALQASGQAPEAAVVAKRRLGLIRASTGRVRDGLALCQESLDQAQATMVMPLIKSSELAVAEVKFRAGDAAGARVLAVGLAQYFAAKGQNESELRALALAAAASQGDLRTGYSANANLALEKLRQSLGADAFVSFTARLDIRATLKLAEVVSGIR